MPRTAKRGLRISLRVFLLTSLTVGSAFGWLYYQAEQQTRAIDQLVNSGFTLAYDSENVYRGWVNQGFGGGRLDAVKMPSGSLVDEPVGVSWLAKFGLQSLGSPIVLAVAKRSWLDKEKYPGLKNNDLKPLRKLRGLKILEVEYSSISDNGLQYLAGLTELEELNLDGNNISDAGLVHLENLQNLKSISLSQNNITDAGLASIGKLKKLESLTLQETNIKGSTLGALFNLRKLKHLRLSHSPVENDHIKQLENLPNLEHLCLDETGLNDDAISSIGKLKKLRHFSADSTAISDDFILGLQTTSLQWLSIDYTNVSAKSLEKIKAWPLSYYSDYDSKIEAVDSVSVSDAIQARENQN